MNLNAVRKCEICGVESTSKNRVGNHSKSGSALCNKHRQQYNRHGSFSKQTRADPNKITIDGNVAYIHLNDFHGFIIAKAIIDVEDIDKIVGYKWFMRQDGRVVSNITASSDGKTHVRLHNVIMNPNNGYIVDHINGDTLDNRKFQLRIVTEKQNSKNNTIQTNNTSGVTGVVLSQSNTWVPQIKKDRKMIRLGNEKSFDEAVKKRIKAEANYFKEYTRNYNIETDTIQLKYLSHDDQKQTFIECDLDGNIIKFEKENI